MMDKPKFPTKTKWQGPFVFLHLREVNGMPCLFDDQNRMVGGIRNLTVTYELDGILSAKAELFLTSPPTEQVS